MSSSSSTLATLATVITTISVIGVYSACSTPPNSGAKTAQFNETLGAERGGTASTRPTRAELEDDILRFEGQFSAGIYDAFRTLSRSTDNGLRRQAIRLRLTYSSAALNVAIGALPEQNLLDMVVLTELVRDTFRDYWVPEVFKADGKPVLAALEKTSKDLEKVALTYLTPAQISELRSLASDWHDRNPKIVSVEGIRLSDFSAKAGARAKEIESGISGILAPVNAANASADRAILLGERGLYYAQKSPTLFRMQSTAAVQDVLQEVESTLSELPELPVSSDEIRQLLIETQSTLRELHPVVSELKGLTELASKNPRLVEGSGKMLESLADVIKEYNLLLKSGAVQSPSQMVGLADRIKAETRNLFFGIFLVGALLILFCGVIYVAAKLTYEHFRKVPVMKTNADETRKAA